MSSIAPGNYSTRKHSEVQVDPSVPVTGHRLCPPLLQVITAPWIKCTAVQVDPSVPVTGHRLPSPLLQVVAVGGLIFFSAAQVWSLLLL